MRALPVPAALAACALILPTGAALAGFFEDAFPDGKDGRVSCYTRSYDEAHLKANPKQKVTFFSLVMETDNQDSRANRPEDFQLQVGVEARGSKERFYGHAYCKAEAAEAHCFLEGDGGRLSLKPGEGGRLRVVAGDYGLAFEGSDFLQIGAAESDDNAFLLDKSAPDACAEKEPEE